MYVLNVPPSMEINMDNVNIAQTIALSVILVLLTVKNVIEDFNEWALKLRRFVKKSNVILLYVYVFWVNVQIARKDLEN